jgi:L-threonylcarbamoyladenylate synthase
MSNILEEELKALEILKNGGVILCHTDTVWSLCCDAYNQPAVNKIVDIKKKEPNNYITLLVQSINHLKQYIQDIHPRIETLIHYHRRPITVLYKAKKSLPIYLTSSDGTIAIRVVKDPNFIQLLRNYNSPMVCMSANVSGRQVPKNYNDIDLNIISKVDYILSSNRSNDVKSQSSMLVSYDEEGELIFLRK